MLESVWQDTFSHGIRASSSVSSVDAAQNRAVHNKNAPLSCLEKKQPSYGLSAESRRERPTEQRARQATGAVSH